MGRERESAHARSSPTAICRIADTNPSRRQRWLWPQARRALGGFRSEPAVQVTTARLRREAEMGRTRPAATQQRATVAGRP